MRVIIVPLGGCRRCSDSESIVGKPYLQIPSRLPVIPPQWQAPVELPPSHKARRRFHSLVEQEYLRRIETSFAKLQAGAPDEIAEARIGVEGVESGFNGDGGDPTIAHLICLLEPCQGLLLIAQGNINRCDL